MTTGKKRPVRMSRKQRRQKKQRQMILLGFSLVLLVVVLIIAVLAFKGKVTNGSEEQTEPKQTLNAVNQDVTDQNVPDSGSAAQDTGVTTQPSAQEETNVTSKGFKIEQIDGVTYVDGVLIANKTYALPSTFIPQNPDVPVTEARSNKSLDKDLMVAWKKMQADASAKGLNIYIASGYRSYQYQVTLYNNYVAKDGKAMADTYSSRPGSSEHQTGLCFDLNSIEDSFADTAEGKWVNDNCYKYGFCIRFPKGKDEYTGYQYESWHLRYVGEELAEKLYNNGNWISLEEYFGITSEYAD